MKKECMVSVMCTAFNHEEYIAQALEGMLCQQTDFEYEILINDDCSTDGTAAIIREYEAKYPDRIRAFYQEKNLYSQDIDIYYAVFFPAARGKYTAFCEGDDYWSDPTKLQQQVDFLEAHPEYSACVHNTTLRYCGVERSDELLLESRGDRDVEFEDILPGMNKAWHTSSLVCKTELLASPPDYYYVACDYGFGDYPYGIWLRHNGKVHLIDKSMSVYRINSNAAAWSSGVDYEYKKLRTFIIGKVEMLKVFLPQAAGDVKPLVEQEILEKEFELMYIEGRDRDQRRPPYDKIFRAKPFKYRLINAVKCALPGLHAIYRRRRGYTE